MSPSDPVTALSAEDGGPVFDQPWHAQALAMAHTLVEAGRIDAVLWSETLGGKLRAAASGGAPDASETYYAAVLAALEEILAESGAAAPSEVEARRADWEEAYRRTPHGAPVQLAEKSGGTSAR